MLYPIACAGIAGKPYASGGSDASAGTADLDDITSFIIGLSDEVPAEFTAVNARRVIWKESGVVLPGFDGDDALLLLQLVSIEGKRRQRDAEKANQARE